MTGKEHVEAILETWMMDNGKTKDDIVWSFCLRTVEMIRDFNQRELAELVQSGMEPTTYESIVAELATDYDEYGSIDDYVEMLEWSSF